MAIKSVPPLVTRTPRHRLTAKPLIIPPKMAISKMSSVISRAGTRSVKILVRAMVKQEYKVNRLPTSLKLIKAGMALRARLIGPKGSSIPANSSAHRWTRRVIPVKPPGNKSPAATKLFRFTATMIEDAVITNTRTANSCSRAF